MTNATHTPGPWQISPIFAQYGQYVVETTKPRGGQRGNMSVATCGGEENAHLIAAAPELLESLKKILGNFQSCIAQGNGALNTDAQDIEQALAAIAKAERKD